MHIEIINDIEQFFSLREDWNALLESSASNCVFLTHEWLSAWWNHLADGRQLFILTARESGRLAGVLPVSERGAQVARMMPRSLEFLGSGIIGSDYLDVVIRKGRESEVIGAFADTLNSRGLMLQLSQLRTGTCVAAVLAEQLRKNHWTIAQINQNICPYIDLRGHTWQSYLATVGSNLRKNVNRYLRNLPKDFDMRIECVQSERGAQSALD